MIPDRNLPTDIQELQDRLRQAELARGVALANVQQEQRRLRHVVAALAVVTLLLILAAGGAGWWYQVDQANQAAEAEERSLQEKRTAAQIKQSLRDALDRAEKTRTTLQAQLSQMEAAAEGQRLSNEQNIRDALDRANRARDALHEQLKRPGGVFQLLNNPAPWEFMIKSARAEWQRAKDIETGAEGKVDKTLREQIDKLDRQLQQDDVERRLAERLEKIREDRSILVEGKFNHAQAEQAYHRVFEEAGLAPAPKDNKKDEPIKQSAIREQLIAALDDWGSITSTAGLRKQILAAARRADPDPWRDQLRDPRLWDDPKALEKLAEQALKDGTLDQLFPQQVSLCAALLERTGGNAEQWLRQGQRHYPADFWINFQLGSLLSRKRSAEAAGYYYAALAIRPANSAAWTNLGVALQNGNDPDAAIEAYKKALAIDPKNTMAWINLGAALREKGDLDAAIAAYRRALAIDPTLARGWDHLGVALKDKKDLPGAVEAWKKALAIDHHYASAYVNLGVALHERKDSEAAIAAFKQALTIDPKFAAAWTHLGAFLHDQRDFAGASVAHKKALAIDPKFAAAWFNLGRTLHEQKDLAGSLDCFNKLLALDSKDADDPAKAYRYHAARAAIQAAAAKLDDKERAKLRNQAQDWLRADLAAWTKVLRKDAASASLVQENLKRWQADADLAGVRDDKGLTSLSKEEQISWRQLWADVEGLRKSAGAAQATPK